MCFLPSLLLLCDSMFPICFSSLINVNILSNFAVSQWSSKQSCRHSTAPLTLPTHYTMLLTINSHQHMFFVTFPRLNNKQLKMCLSFCLLLPSVDLCDQPQVC